MNQKTVTSDRQGNQAEVMRWTEAEAKAYQRKYKAYEEAAANVNEFLDFLKEQYAINAKDGWQLGDGCFVRPLPKEDAPVEEAPVKVTTAPPTGKARKVAKDTKNPGAVIAEPLPVLANGHDTPALPDIPQEEM